MVFGIAQELAARVRVAARQVPPLRGRAGASAPERQVSVLIPAYNHQRWLGAALESALGQSLRPSEILCCDDGSGDGTYAVAERYARDFPEVRAWRRENRGAHATLNELLAAARSPLVAVLNSDDLWHPSRLARCVDALVAAPDLAAVATGLVSIGPDGEPAANEWYDHATTWARKAGDLAAGLVHGNFLSTTSNLVARRASLEALGGFDALRYTHDLELFLRLLSSGRGLAVLPEALLAYRVHPANTNTQKPATVRAEWAAVVAAHLRICGLEAAALPPEVAGSANAPAAGTALFADALALRGLQPTVAEALARLGAFPDRKSVV